jgi:EAL domain-containing protein (putative c-di-GMP-specific phosphodiesterase class I)
VVLSYRILMDSETGKLAFQRLTEVSTREELRLVMFELDCVMVGRAVDALHKLLARSGRAQLLVPVNFSTLDDRARRERYMNLCHDIPPHYKKFLLFHLQGTPIGIAAMRLAEIARKLQAHGQGVLVDFPANQTPTFDFIGSSFHGIAIHARSLADPVGEATQRLTRLALTARTAGLKVFVLGADTAGSVEAAVAAHVDCIEGRGIALPRSSPQSAYQWNPRGGI